MSIDRDARLISDRYRILAVLGRGGMGAVYRARDEATDQVVALKILEHRDPNLVAYFEREYHTLASLQHSSVIEVYGFGIAEGGERYYTMEHLPGEDLQALSPLSVDRTCAHLCDIATSLSLLHARRLLHRDVSPRNVRLDAQGRAKLLDFGALTDFGSADAIVGTPPCMSPEALQGLELDQRSDLFSLGALAYYALTRRMPFPGCTLDQVKASQRSGPAAPSELVPNVPGDLDRLIFSLLSLDRLERPSSAAEVIDRLSAIANLDGKSSRDLAESALRSPALVGRGRECQQLKRQLTQATRGSSSVVLLEAAPGMGRTRLGEEFSIEARLLGMTTTRVDALSHSEPGGALRCLARRALEAAPGEARRALRGLGSSSQVLFEGPEAGLSGVQGATAGAAHTTRSARRLEDAFVAFMLAVAERKALAVWVDDAHALDPESARALWLLAHAARGSRLVLLLTASLEAQAPALQPLTRVAKRILLRGLASDEVEEFVNSVFGEVPHRVRLTRWLIAAGRGNPGQSLELLKDLVERELIRYTGGTWVLPSELRERDLPRSIEEALTARISRLDTVELPLLRTLALYRRALPSRTCLMLGYGDNEAEVMQALERLIAQDLVLRSSDSFRFGTYATRELVLGAIAAEELRRLHCRLADALVASHRVPLNRLEKRELQHLSTRDLGTLLEIGFHLQCSGRTERGFQVQQDAAAELGIRGDGLSEAVPTLEASVAMHIAAGGSEFETAPLLVPLALAGTYSDYRLSYRYGEQVLTLLLQMTGMERARRLKRFLGGRVALFVCLAAKLVAFRLKNRSALARSFREVLLGLVGVASGLLGTYSVMFDRARARGVAERLEMLGYFPKHHPLRVVHTLQAALVDAAHGESAGAASKAMSAFAALERPNVQQSIPAQALLQLRVGCLTPSSLAHSQRLDEQALATFLALEKLGSSVSPQIVAGARTVYYGHRGERAKFVQCREEMDMLASIAGSTWREDVGTPRQMWSTYVLAEDVLGLKRCAHDLDAVAEQVASIRPIRDAARACYLAERGKPAEALAQYGKVFEREIASGSQMAARFAGAYARILRAGGEPLRAREVCARALAALSPEQLEYTLAVLGAQLELALATALLGEPERALHQLDALTEAQGEHDNPLVHGLMHKTRAQIALWRADAGDFARERSSMERWFRKTGNPALIAQCQRLSKEARVRGLSMGHVNSEGAERISSTGDLQLSFQACNQAGDRVQLALDLAMEYSGAERGYLYLLSPTGLRLAAPLVGSEPPEAVLRELDARLDELRRAPAELSPREDLTMTVSESDPTTVGLGTHLSYPVCFREGADLSAIGALALFPGTTPLSALEPSFLEALARALHAAADVRATYMEDVAPAQTTRARPHPACASRPE